MAEAKTPKTNKDGSARKAPVRKDLPALDFTKLTVTAVTDPSVMRTFKRTRGERDKEQVQIDSLVRQAHERWVAAGSPENWDDCPGLQLKVPAAQYDTLVTRARRAGAYFDLGIRFGSRRDANGYAEVVLVAKDKPVKGAEDGADSE